MDQSMERQFLVIAAHWQKETEMVDTLVQRQVARIDSPPISRRFWGLHRIRPLIPPGDWAFTDPFLLLMEDWFPDGVFDRPHRGIETVTYVIDGGVEHYDNHGNEGTIAPGDARWLTAGRGLIHNEYPRDGGVAHTLQLWVNLPAKDKLVQAHHQNLQAASLPKRWERGAELTVFSGSSGSVKASTTNHAPVTMVQIDLDKNISVELDVPAGYNGFVVVLKGDATIGTDPTAVKAVELAWLTASDDESSVQLRAGDKGAKALLIAGLPLRESIAARGPFVMNTEDELQDGFSEYRAQGAQFGLQAL
jgi:redox-sensitive bicupin YhaK (pirin superfamily)